VRWRTLDIGACGLAATFAPYRIPI